MAIPQEQLTTWSNIGAQEQSKTTYATIRAALERSDIGFPRKPEIFLQGSYGNDTNIRTESDVDVVICYPNIWFRNLDALTSQQVAIYKQTYPDATYTYAQFSSDVHRALSKAFEGDVTKGTRAFNVAANGTRRKADVIAAFEFHRYAKFNSVADYLYAPNGIGFLNSDKVLIENYPKTHAANLTTKNQATNQNFKPIVRIFKNIRSRLVSDGTIAARTAPSYFIEGLLHNAPNELFASNYAESVRALLVWMVEEKDRNSLKCAHRLHPLIGEGNSVCWPDADALAYMNASVKLWNEWK